MDQLPKDKLSPHNIVLLGIFFLGLIYLLAPLRYEFPSFEGVMFLLILVITFIFSSIFGTFIFRTKNHPHQLAQFNQIKNIFYICFAFSLIGIFLRIYDNFVIRGFDLSQGPVQMRLALQNLNSDSSEVAQAGILSIFGAFFYGFTYALAIFAINWWKNIPKVIKPAVVFFSLYPAIEGYLMAGTSGAAFLYLFLFFSFYQYKLISNSLKALNFKFYLLFFFLAILIIIIGGTFFIFRIDEMYGDLTPYLNYISKAHFVRPSEFLIENIEKPSIGKTLFIFFWFCDYLLQSVAEYSYLYQSQGETLGLGIHQFGIIAKFFSIIGIGNYDPEIIAAMNPRSGRFQSFFGPVLLDFGLLGSLIQTTILGVVASWIYSKKNSNLRLFLYPYIQAMIVSGFLLNGFTGQKFYFFVALIFTITLYPLFSKRKRV